MVACTLNCMISFHRENQCRVAIQCHRPAVPTGTLKIELDSCNQLLQNFVQHNAATRATLLTIQHESKVYIGEDLPDISPFARQSKVRPSDFCHYEQIYCVQSLGIRQLSRHRSLASVLSCIHQTCLCLRYKLASSK